LNSDTYSAISAATKLGIAVGGSERIRIENGYVGIGSVTPGAALDVSGDIKLSGTIAQEAWISPTFQNSWANYGEWETAGYYKDKEGVVHLKGLVTGGTVGAIIFTLPAGYRPSAGKHIATVAAGNACTLQIMPDGTILTYSTCGNSWITLDNISFRP
jgi:hypothetical protein